MAAQYLHAHEGVAGLGALIRHRENSGIILYGLGPEGVVGELLDQIGPGFYEAAEGVAAGLDLIHDVLHLQHAFCGQHVATEDFIEVYLWLRTRREPTSEL